MEKGTTAGKYASQRFSASCAHQRDSHQLCAYIHEKGLFYGYVDKNEVDIHKKACFYGQTNKISPKHQNFA